MKTLLILQVFNFAFFMSWIPSCMLKNSYDYIMPDAGITIQIPASYQEISMKDYIEMIEASNLDDDSKGDQVEVLKHLNRTQGMSYFMDTLNQQNVLSIVQSRRYIPIDKMAIDIGMEYLKDILKAQGNKFIKKHKIEEKKISRLDQFSYFKLKIEQEGDFGTRWFTNYVISTENETSIEIVSINHDGKDFEELIRKIGVSLPEE